MMASSPDTMGHQETLDSLLGLIGESLERIEANPSDAYGRVVARQKSHKATGDDYATQDRSSGLAVDVDYGHHVIGNFLICSQRTLTKEDLDRMTDEIMRYKP